MLKKVYLVRHCEATGQLSEARLTNEGLKQALELCEYFSNIKIDQIISSPYNRAIESIQPLAKELNIDIETDRKLEERILSSQNHPDWFEKLRKTFDDLDLKFEGGESSIDAMNRIVEVVKKVFKSNNKTTIIVTHGNLMSLLLKHFNNNFGFDDWKSLSNPDIYLLKKENKKISTQRLWHQEKA